MYLETDPSLQREIAELIMLRRHLDSLEEKMQEKEFAVDKARLVHLWFETTCLCSVHDRFVGLQFL